MKTVKTYAVEDYKYYFIDDRDNLYTCPSGQNLDTALRFLRSKGLHYYRHVKFCIRQSECGYFRYWRIICGHWPVEVNDYARRSSFKWNVLCFWKELENSGNFCLETLILKSLKYFDLEVKRDYRTFVSVLKYVYNKKTGVEIDRTFNDCNTFYRILRHHLSKNMPRKAYKISSTSWYTSTRRLGVPSRFLQVIGFILSKRPTCFVTKMSKTPIITL